MDCFLGSSWSSSSLSRIFREERRVNGLIFAFVNQNATGKSNFVECECNLNENCEYLNINDHAEIRVY